MSIDGVLRRQGGVITRRQAIQAGMAPAAIDEQLRRRRWRPLHPRVYLAAGCPLDAEVRARAALLWAGPGAVLAGAAAAGWHGLPCPAPDRLTVTVPRRPPPDRPGLVLRHRALAAADRTELRGLGLTALPLTVLETALELGPDGPRWLDRALRTRLDPAALRETLGRHPSPRAERLLGAAAGRAAVTTRNRLVRVLRESGTTGWCGGPGPSVTFPAARVAVEVTSWADPASPRTPVAHSAPGWTVLRLHWRELVDRPAAALAAIAAALDPGEMGVSAVAPKSNSRGDHLDRTGRDVRHAVAR